MMDPMVVHPVRALGMGGLIKDIRGHERTFAAMSTANNVRFEDGSIATIPAGTAVEGLQLESTPVFSHPFILQGGGHVICYGDGEVYYYDATTAGRKISPTGGTMSSAGEWYACQVNEFFFLTNGVDVPHQITGTEAADGSSVLKPMTNWPANYRCGVMDNYKNFVVAGKITIDGNRRYSLVKWSQPISPGDEEIFWDFTDPTLLAGENELAVAGRSIEGLQRLRDDLIIYFDQSVWKMTLVGGANVMNFSKIFGDDGIIGRHAHCEVKGQAIVFGNRSIYSHDGFNKTSISDGKLTRWLYKNHEIRHDIYMSYYPQRQEVYIVMRSASSMTEGDVGFIYDVEHSAFTTMTYPGPTNEGGVSQFYMGPKFDRDLVSYADAEGMAWTYDNSAQRSYNSSDINDDDLALYVLSKNNSELVTLDLYTPVSHNPTEVMIEFDKLDFEPPFQTTGDKMKFVTRLFPQCTGKSVIQISLGVSSNTEAGVYWYPYVDYDVTQDYAVDLRASGRYLSLRVKMQPGQVENFSISGFDIEMIVPHAGRH